MNALLAQFIPEARDLLEQAGAGMLALERDAHSPTVINDVFRAVHTLKGSSGLFDIAPLTRLVHAAEDLLDEVRTGQLELTSEIVDRLLDSLDLVGRWIDALEAREQLPADAESTMAARVEVLRGWLSRNAAPPRPGAAAAVPAAAAPDWLVDIPEDERLAAYKAVRGRRLVAWSFVPEPDCFFRGDDPVATVRHAPGLLAIRVLPRQPFPAFAALDPLACNLRFEILSDASRDSIEEHMRYVADNIDVRDIAAAELAIVTGTPATGPVFADFARVAPQHLMAADRAGFERLVAALLNMAAPSCFQASALRWCSVKVETHGLGDTEGLLRLIAAVGTGALTPPSTTFMVSAPPGAEPGPQVHRDADDDTDRALAYGIARQQLKMLETPADPSIQGGRIESVGAVLKNLGRAVRAGDISHDVDAAVGVFRNSGDLQPLQDLVELLVIADAPLPTRDGSAAAAAATPTASAPETAEPRAGDAAPEGKSINRVLRIDQLKIDSIMNLVAELIVAKNGLSYLATRAEKVHGSRVIGREIKDQFSVIDRITQGLQVSVMSVRMMPVGQVFQRFPRLVRDISRKLGKQIDLVIEGEDTEADKNVLESLADPLIHMVRNSLDHGIEPPDERTAVGKPAHGTLKITARHENDFVVIEVVDDGRGIDPERVRSKAVKLGILAAEDAGQMTDEDAVNLVFAPGFSTKEEVSDLSGRGVGMDVVRSAVVKAGGDVTLRSTLGTGTSVTVRLPLTMAVTRIVTIECRDRIFGIPMDRVVETVRIRRDQIRRIKDRETFVLRDNIIPIVRLARSLGLVAKTALPLREDEAVMVVRIGRDLVGMVVDGFRERMEVIVKPLEGILEGLRGFAGTALLGDGRVLLVLDLAEML